ncbi:MAG TPA: 2-amino-4-hydroxy-6-hydroxymethyldihydropteridine diphosphokinase [Kofleriaceae bacterium]|nr:2-amino-4-hydroxy-6-hydroxymethyldihydropteridine diphosphokinase [Kofleriaceae bacterium]
MLADDALVIGLGGNVGGEPAIIERFVRAREAFAQLGDVKSAALYRTAPIGPAQASFLNSAIRVRWRGAIASEVMATVLEIERLLGRDRRGEVRWGPRTIDLDVLVWGSRVILTPELEVPHPRLGERRFALQPLVDLVGAETILPGSHDTLGALVQRVAAQELELLQSSW